jgi:hypothetical protein
VDCEQSYTREFGLDKQILEQAITWTNGSALMSKPRVESFQPRSPYSVFT